MGMLRVLLALCVVIAHVGYGFLGYQSVGSEIAVQLFYIVSGFYIGLILNEKYSDVSQNTIFYLNRFLRIFGIYWLILAAALVLALLAAHGGGGPLMHWKEASGRLGVLDYVYLVVANLFVIGQDFALMLRIGDHGLAFGNSHQSQPHVFNLMLIPVAWSLALELYFYIIAPFIARRHWSWVAGVALLCLAARAVAAANGVSVDPFSYRFFPFELTLFLEGVLAYRIFQALRDRMPHRRALELGMAFLGAVAGYQLYGDPQGSFFFDWPRLFILSAALIGVPTLHLSMSRVRWDRTIGELSYPIYLCHLLVLMVAAKLLGDRSAWLPFATVAGTIMASVLIVAIVDRPLDAFRQRLARRSGAKVSDDAGVAVHDPEELKIGQMPDAAIPRSETANG